MFCACGGGVGSSGWCVVERSGRLCVNGGGGSSWLVYVLFCRSATWEFR